MAKLFRSPAISSHSYLQKLFLSINDYPGLLIFLLIPVKLKQAVEVTFDRECEQIIRLEKPLTIQEEWQRKKQKP